jgi:quercetin dioxygenase-like cupin family protein
MVRSFANEHPDADGNDDAGARRFDRKKGRGSPNSDQVLLMLKGKLSGKVGEEKVRLEKGDVLVIPAGTPHRFKNNGRKPAVTFNVYSPPEYPVGMKG